MWDRQDWSSRSGTVTRRRFPPPTRALTWRSVDFHIPHGETIALLRRCGFVIERLIEVRPPEGSTTNFPLVTLEWARQWPCEEIWMARKQS